MLANVGVKSLRMRALHRTERAPVMRKAKRKLKIKRTKKKNISGGGGRRG